METRNQTRMDGMEQRLACFETKLSELSASVNVISQGQQKLDQELKEQDEFRKYITGLVQRSEKTSPNEEELGSLTLSPSTTLKTLTGESGGHDKGAFTMSNLVGTLDDLFSAEKTG
ncbi:hypothetical protein SESBI_38384 [Sesbania bispinosa]|nr:hypothetical protein SESBI_38384 [Sesbania bispinosa]